MNIPTPTPVHFCNHKNIKTNLLVKQHNIQLYPASTLKKDLPEGLCVSKSGRYITYRFCWQPKQPHWSNHYFEIATHDTGMNYYQGRSLDYNMHRSFLRTYKIVKPIAELIFNPLIFAEAA